MADPLRRGMGGGSMASDSWAKELLADVARDLHDSTKYGTFSSHVDVINAFDAVLERRLLRLFEAGEAMRDNHPCWNPHNVIADTLGLAKESIVAWDAAKSAALKEATDGER